MCGVMSVSSVSSVKVRLDLTSWLSANGGIVKAKEMMLPPPTVSFGVLAAVEKAKSFDVDNGRAAVYGLEFDAPGGKKKMDEKNQHTYKPVYIGKIRADGQFDSIWKTPDLVEPEAFSHYLKDAPKDAAPEEKKEEKK